MDLVVPGRPTPKGRARVVGHRAYTPPLSAAAERAIAWCWRAAGAPTAPPDAWLRVRITARFTPPARPNRRYADGSLPLPRPDVDNLAKLVLDALNGLAWADDRLIVDLRVGKGWTTGPPSTRITGWVARDGDDADDSDSGPPGGTR